MIFTVIIITIKIIIVPTENTVLRFSFFFFFVLLRLNVSNVHLSEVELYFMLCSRLY